MRTYEPLKFLGRLFFVPLKTANETPAFTLTHTWETEGEYRFAHTLVIRLKPFKRALGVGWWLDTEVTDLASEMTDRIEQAAANAAYDAYVMVNGEVDREEWNAARKQIASEGLDMDDEMEIMQGMGIFGGQE